MVEWRKDAEHEKTPTRVSVRAVRWMELGGQSKDAEHETTPSLAVLYCAPTFHMESMWNPSIPYIPYTPPMDSTMDSLIE